MRYPVLVLLAAVVSAQTPAFHIFNSFSITCRVDAGTAPKVMETDYHSGLLLTVTGGKYQFLPNRAAGAGVSGGTPTPGVPQFLAATYDGMTARLYVDGLPVASAPIANNTAAAPNLPTYVLRVSGGVQDAVLYNRALTDSEVAQISRK